MASPSLAIRKCLEDGDVQGLFRLTGERPSDPERAFHLARTKAESVSTERRQYSHCWLVERGYQSLLPIKDRPVIIRASVGIAVKSKSKEVKAALTTAMEDAVRKAYADGVQDPLVIRQLIREAREREKRGLMLALAERAK